MYNLSMKIIRLDEVDSTHTYLKEYLLHNEINELICIVTDMQTNGIGSRGNSWSGDKGNLFFSFAIKKENLPKDLPLQSISIYFSFILKLVLNKLSSKVWLKWPNDFYINDKKIGGTITTATKDVILCGIGLNMVSNCQEYGLLDIDIEQDKLLNSYLENIEKKLSWQDIFSEYVIEFQRSKKFQATIHGKKVSLEEAKLNNDGSIEINNEKVFSLR